MKHPRPKLRTPLTCSTLRMIEPLAEQACWAAGCRPWQPGSPPAGLLVPPAEPAPGLAARPELLAAAAGPSSQRMPAVFDGQALALPIPLECALSVLHELCSLPSCASIRPLPLSVHVAICPTPFKAWSVTLSCALLAVPLPRLPAIHRAVFLLVISISPVCPSFCCPPFCNTLPPHPGFPAASQPLPALPGPFQTAIPRPRFLAPPLTQTACTMTMPRPKRPPLGCCPASTSCSQVCSHMQAHAVKHRPRRAATWHAWMVPSYPPQWLVERKNKKEWRGNGGQHTQK